MGEKLTKAQLSFLQLIADQGEVDTTWAHRNAEALFKRGLVTIRRYVPASRFVGGQVVKITPAGRLALSEADNGRG